MLPRYTEQARRDLIDIHHAISDHHPSIANAHIRRITERCRQLAIFPESGPMRTDIAPDARVLVVERWIAIYRLRAYGAQIVRVVDGARDLTDLDLPKE